MTNEDALQAIASDNLFQYPTDREIGSIARACFARLDAMGDELSRLAAEGTAVQAAQANLYAMMLLYRLIERFMMEEAAPRLASLDHVLSRADVGSFLERYQARFVADGWSDATVKKLRGVLSGILAGAGMRSSARSDELHPVPVDPEVEAGVCANGRSALLAAFDGRAVAEEA